MTKVKLPSHYQEAREWASLFIKRIDALEEAYQDETYRTYLTITGSPERASVRRTSMDLTKALVEVRKPNQ